MTVSNCSHNCVLAISPQKVETQDDAARAGLSAKLKAIPSTSGIVKARDTDFLIEISVLAEGYGLKEYGYTHQLETESTSYR